MGDLMTADHVGCTLIEFEKDKTTISSEVEKYPLTPAQREVAGRHYAKAINLLAPKLFTMPGAQAHYLIFGATTTPESGRPQLYLCLRQYGDQTPVLGNELLRSDQLGSVSAFNLIAYMEELSKCRGKKVTDLGGMVFASVGGETVCSMTLTEFVEHYEMARGQKPEHTHRTPPVPERKHEGPSFGR
ncbi:MAG: hypothetical protein Q7K57_54335 [Burkholderiaceae bacterium]|nr:hypothetical protein [Burkholderiaceae bacterium]